MHGAINHCSDISVSHRLHSQTFMRLHTDFGRAERKRGGFSWMVLKTLWGSYTCNHFPAIPIPIPGFLCHPFTKTNPKYPVGRPELCSQSQQTTIREESQAQSPRSSQGNCCCGTEIREQNVQHPTTILCPWAPGLSGRWLADCQGPHQSWCLCAVSKSDEQVSTWPGGGEGTPVTEIRPFQSEHWAKGTVGVCAAPLHSPVAAPRQIIKPFPVV